MICEKCGGEYFGWFCHWCSADLKVSANNELPDTSIHIATEVHPTPQEMLLERIACALERIADVLEKK